MNGILSTTPVVQHAVGLLWIVRCALLLGRANAIADGEASRDAAAPSVRGECER